MTFLIMLSVSDTMPRTKCSCDHVELYLNCTQVNVCDQTIIFFSSNALYEMVTLTWSSGVPLPLLPLFPAIESLHLFLIVLMANKIKQLIL